MTRETRKPSAAALPDVTFNQTGRVTHDDRGNAIWEWAGNDAEVRESPTQELKKLDNPTLSLADDVPLSPGDRISNPLGTVTGYSPYDSGILEKKQAPRKKDLRRLSEWMKLKKSVEKAKSGAE